jgi:hypothetical protein
MVRDTDNVQIMPPDFVPTRRGRKPLIEVEEIIASADEASGQWVRWEFSGAEANSVLRQLVRHRDNYETASERLPAGDRRAVYIRLLT